ncbi:hypothetical protein THMIRHAS_17080 [Thiosulfatimonas sediminis]|uniref:Single-stranded DNA-binding protein n=1 Tax=Thiosulfatimonas sediminis TaxID=2675054 RepID=A0A6F8PW38_9GAMM|nr:single-stranded DNA-binding protein [Thiosulfatimonas sediminis]BBP46335.1 hypothetical protein THMIRHAS_17080 [Thiosulfatimonas sediminis]
MANQEVKLTGNIGQDLVFKQQGDRSLAEISLVCEEYKQTDEGVQVREGTQNWYNVTVWGKGDSLAPLNVLQKGMRIQVSGALRPSLFQKDDGTVGLGLAVNCQAGDVLIKMNRIDHVVMRKRDDQNGFGQQGQGNYEA